MNAARTMRVVWLPRRRNDKPSVTTVTIHAAEVYQGMRRAHRNISVLRLRNEIGTIEIEMSAGNGRRPD